MRFIDLAFAKDFILNKIAGKEECPFSSCLEKTIYTCLRCERLTKIYSCQKYMCQLYQRPSLKTSQNKIFKTTIEENITLFKQRLRYRGYLDNFIDKTLSEVNFRERMSALQNKQQTRKKNLPFVTEYRPSVPNLKQFI